MKKYAITINVLPDEKKFVEGLCHTHKMKRAEVLRGLINRAMRTPKFRPDKLFDSTLVKLTPEERALLNKKYNMKVYRKGSVS